MYAFIYKIFLEWKNSTSNLLYDYYDAEAIIQEEEEGKKNSTQTTNVWNIFLAAI